MENTITFTYNPYFYFNSYTNVLENLKKHYPNEEVFIYFDGGRADLNKYIEVSNYHKCNTYITQNDMGYLDRKDSYDINNPKMQEWIRRLVHTCNNSNSKWIMLLEDDVLIKRKIKYWPDSDCGINREWGGFLGGGSIFKREKFLECINNVDVNQLIKDNHWAGDMLLKDLFLLSKSTYEKWIELAEPNYYENTDHAVFHGYKELHKLG